MSFDVIVIGAGHNGLVCAARLAQAGRKVLVLEKRARAGGLSATDEFHPGFSAPGPVHNTSGLSSRVINALKLHSHSLSLKAKNQVQVLQPDGREFGIADGELDGVETADRDAYQEWRAFIKSVTPVLRSMAERPPPNMHPQALTELWPLARAGIGLRALGKKRMVELLRMAPMAAADWLNEFFPDPAVSEALLGPSLLGIFMGPWSGGSAFNLLFRECLRERGVEGGTAGLVDALMAACKNAGVEMRFEHTVRHILVDDRQVRGVRTTEGKLRAPVVVAGCDPKTAMLTLVDPAQLDLRIDHQFRSLRARGTAAKVNLALRGEPAFGDARLTTGSLDSLERAFDAVKYGGYSDTPFLDISVLAGAPYAPENHHVLSVLAGYAPHAPRGGWSLEQEDLLADTVIDRIAVHMPDVRERIVAREVLMPADIAERYGAWEGQIHHVEPALDQLLSMRPTISTSRYRTPINGLYLTGAGCHPVSGISGLPGLLAADTIKTGTVPVS